jgi:hypothetical protein
METVLSFVVLLAALLVIARLVGLIDWLSRHRK